MNIEADHTTAKLTSTKIPTPMQGFKRSSSVRIRGEKANLSSSVPVTSTTDDYENTRSRSPWIKNYGPLNLNRSRVNSSSRLGLDDDLESIGSVTSNFSVATTHSACEHVNFAKNGTTYSGRSHKYIVHCSSGWNEQEEYLTPTQRANRSIKKLKSLLQLAREILREKEEEIFKLNREVIELKTYKATVESSPLSGTQEENVPNTLLNTDSKIIKNFTNESFYELSPKKHVSEHVHNFKVSPSPSQDGMADKSSITPDILFSSMADSGNFDDLPSSASVYSKDSLNFLLTSDIKQSSDQGDGTVFEEAEEDRDKLIADYEKKLEDKRLEYESELNKVMNSQEERNMKIIREFEEKLKEEELKFEMRWNELLKSTEEEKMAIVNRFEDKLEEEREKYRENLSQFTSQQGKITDMEFEATYCRNVNEEKTIYETALMDIREKFESEKQMIEKRFDDTMTAERLKFEDNLKTIQQICDVQVADLTKKVNELETGYSQLLPKYEKAVSENGELERENESLKATLKEQEEAHRKMFLTIYKKGQEAARIEMEAQEETDVTGKSDVSKKASMPELFAQLKITEVQLENLKAMYKRLAEAQTKPNKKETSTNDPEATLQFLKSAVYYFLTDRENHLGHLKAIESILAFSSTEKSNIEKLYLNR